MSTREVKELFFAATNEKVVLSSDDTYCEQKLRKAFRLSNDLTDQIWPFITAYRLAHLLFRKAKSEADFNEILKLLDHSEQSRSLYISVHSKLLKFVALNRLKLLGVKNLKEKQKVCRDDIIQHIGRSNAIERSMSDPDRSVQNDYFNILEYLSYATDLEYEPLLGVGYNHGNTLYPYIANDVWRIVGPTGSTVDEFSYNFEDGKIELDRYIRENSADGLFILGNPAETCLTNKRAEKTDTNFNRVQLLNEVILASPGGAPSGDLAEIWAQAGDTSPKEAAKKGRQHLENKIFNKSIFNQVEQGPNTRWSLKENIKIYGLVNVKFLR